MNNFLWKLKSVNEDEEVFYEVKNSLLRVGRSPSKDIICISTLVSRNHASICLLAKGSLKVIDTSINGTWVNGIRIHNRKIHELFHGDIVAFGFNPNIDYMKNYKPPFYIFEVVKHDNAVNVIKESNEIQQVKIENLNCNFAVENPQNCCKEIALIVPDKSNSTNNEKNVEVEIETNSNIKNKKKIKKSFIDSEEISEIMSSVNCEVNTSKSSSSPLKDAQKCNSNSLKKRKTNEKNHEDVLRNSSTHSEKNTFIDVTDTKENHIEEVNDNFNGLENLDEQAAFLGGEQKSFTKNKKVDFKHDKGKERKIYDQIVATNNNKENEGVLKENFIKKKDESIDNSEVLDKLLNDIIKTFNFNQDKVEQPSHVSEVLNSKSCNKKLSKDVKKEKLKPDATKRGVQIYDCKQDLLDTNMESFSNLENDLLKMDKEISLNEKDNFNDTQELLYVLNGTVENVEKVNTLISPDDELQQPINYVSNFIDNEEVPVTSENQLVPSKPEPEPSIESFSHDQIIIIEDEDDYNLPCSQLMKDGQNENNEGNLFMNIKKEFENLDRIDYVPHISVDSDTEFDEQRGENETTNCHIDSNKDEEERVKETDDLNAQKNEKKGSNTNDKISVEFDTSAVTHSVLPSTSKYVIPPIVEPHEGKKRRNNKRENSDLNQQEHKRKKTELNKKSPNKLRNKSNSKKSTLLDSQEKRIRKNLIREKIKEISKKPQLEEKHPVVKNHDVKIKVSEGRGTFLLPEAVNSSTQKRPSINNLVASNVDQKIKEFSISINNNDEVKIGYPFEANPLKNDHKVENKINVEGVINEIVRWSANWLNKQKSSSSSPPVSKYAPKEMGSKFNHYSDYHNVVIPLLFYELWSCIYRDWSSSQNDLRKNRFISRIEEEKMLPSKFISISGLTYIDKKQNANGLFVREDDLVVFECKEKLDGKAIVRTGFGYVTSVCKKFVPNRDLLDMKFRKHFQVTVDFEVNFTFKTKHFSNSADKESLMFIKIVAPMSSYLRLFKSVKYLQYSPLKKFILCPKVEDFAMKELELPRKLNSEVSLNSSQLDAVIKATNCCLGQKPGMFLIQGPPGTGKTTVITTIIREIIHECDFPRRTVLFVAPSNGAVDEVVQRLIKIRENEFGSAKKNKFKFLRIGPSQSINQGSYKYCLDHVSKVTFLRNACTLFPGDFILGDKQKTIWNSEKQLTNDKESYHKYATEKKEFESYCINKYGKEYYNALDKIKMDLLQNVHVICTTLASCYNFKMETVFKNSEKISCCIVDEATQSIEQETLIPLMLGIDKLILVGDPCQLYPTIFSPEAKNLKFGQSLFSRINSLFKDHPKNPIVMLDTQYRMHPEIARFPSKAFYSNKLKNGNVFSKSKFKRLKPYMVFSMSSYITAKEYENFLEVTFVNKVLQSILELTTDTPYIDIGIITPYSIQKNALIRSIKQQEFRKGVTLSINTVDGFQGQEKDVVIISYVRNDGNSFVSDCHRLNVAITRARYALFVIGSRSLFNSCPVLSVIRDDAQKRILLCEVGNVDTVNVTEFISNDEN